MSIAAAALVACGGNVTGMGRPSDGGHDGGAHSGARDSATDADTGVVAPTTPPPPLETTYPTTCFVSDLGLLETRLAPPPGRSNFGAAVLLQGDLLVAATGAAGAAVYRRDGPTWLEEKFLEIPEPTGDPVQMSLSSDTLAVGAPSSAKSGKLAGAVYVMDLAADGGALEQVLTPDPPASGLAFGSSVAIDGTTLAVASNESVTVFTRKDGTWSSSAVVVPDAPAKPANLAVALRGNTLAIGANWYAANSEGSAIFLYRLVSGVFGPAGRVDVKTTTGALGAIPVLGDELLVSGTSTLSIFANTNSGWTHEASLAVAVSSRPALDGARLAVGTGNAVTLFERQGGAWPTTGTLAPHDVAASPIGFGNGAVALHGDAIAVGDWQNQGSGVGAGAVYTYVPAASSSPDCADSAKAPPRIEGTGTGCVEPGSGTAMCPYTRPGTSTVAGKTPYGEVRFPFVWTDVIRGFDRASTLALSNVAPRREGTSPSLSATIPTFERPAIGQPIPVSFLLTLCDRSVTVDGTIELERTTDGGDPDASPLAGTISITRDGWGVTGSFHTDTVCALSVSH